jgi:hypothetical protein
MANKTKLPDTPKPALKPIPKPPVAQVPKPPANIITEGKKPVPKPNIGVPKKSNLAV